MAIRERQRLFHAVGAIDCGRSPCRSFLEPPCHLLIEMKRCFGEAETPYGAPLLNKRDRRPGMIPTLQCQAHPVGVVTGWCGNSAADGRLSTTTHETTVVSHSLHTCGSFCPPTTPNHEKASALFSASYSGMSASLNC